MGCKACAPGGCDTIRGFAKHVIVSDVEPVAADESDIDICGLAYSFTLCGGFFGTGDPPDPPELVAVIRLQDSQFELWSDCCKLEANFPGLKWPAHAKLIVAPGAAVTLNITYGNCSSCIGGRFE